MDSPEEMLIELSFMRVGLPGLSHWQKASLWAANALSSRGSAIRLVTNEGSLFFISHKLTVLEHATQVIELDRGRLLEPCSSTSTPPI